MVRSLDCDRSDPKKFGGDPVSSAKHQKGGGMRTVDSLGFRHVAWIFLALIVAAGLCACGPGSSAADAGKDMAAHPDVGGGDVTPPSDQASPGDTPLSGDVDVGDVASPSDVGVPSDGSQGDVNTANQGSLSGLVYAATVPPVGVAGAKVTAGEATATTDAAGKFTLAHLAATDHALLLVEAAGMTTQQTVAVVQAGLTSNITVYLAPVTSQEVVSGDAATSAHDESGAGVAFPASAFVDPAGNAATGDVMVSLSAIDPREAGGALAFPGSHMATRLDGSSVVFMPVMAVSVTVTQGGQTLQLADGKTVDIGFVDVDPALPDTIQTWSLDEETGNWREEGTATRGTTAALGVDRYVGTFSHLSQYGIGAVGVPSCIKGQVVMPDGSPAAGAEVGAVTVHWEDGTPPGFNFVSNSDASGKFVIQVAGSVTYACWAQLDMGHYIANSKFFYIAPMDADLTQPDQCGDVGILHLVQAEDCPAGFQDCGICVPVMDAKHCGSCDKDCSKLHAQCSGGDCYCPAGTKKCAGGGDVCLDVAWDPYNCGDCGVICPSAKPLCVNGECLSSPCANQPNKPDFCGECTNILTDAENCGHCGKLCTRYGDVCLGGVCQAEVCDGSLINCLGDCVDLQSDKENCGGCHVMCWKPGQTCKDGVCALKDCGAQKLCGENCVDVDTDVQNCGDCGKACPVSGAVCASGQCKCPSPTNVSCNSTCVDTKTDASNCGSCNHVCPSNTPLCVDGQCKAPACDPPFLSCDGECVNTSTDPAHCGNCTTQCSGGHGVCLGSQCLPPGPCPSWTTSCGGKCVDLKTDTLHCGTCTHVCPAGQRCVDGACSSPCPTGETVQLCGGVCANLSTNIDNCGACGNVCGANQVCWGDCLDPCPTGYTDCGGGFCVDTNTNNFNCGGCYMPCPALKTCVGGTCTCALPSLSCSGKCIDPSVDNANCGGCGQACDSDRTCKNGQCACTAGLNDCLGDCVDIKTDDDNCGGCGQVCATPRSCVSGKCTCPTGTSECGGACVNYQTDAANCNGCGHACSANLACVNGACTCPSGWTVCPSGACLNLNSDQQHCGQCNHACGDHEFCSGGTCTTCPGGRRFCKECVDDQTDNHNCGGCGIVCSDTQMCIGGQCKQPNCQAPKPDYCNGACTNTATDLYNCGTCGKFCAGEGAFCSGGQCKTCAYPTIPCDGVCKNRDTDPLNCGYCGHVCPAETPSCVQSFCQPNCAAGETVCNLGGTFVCKALQTDSSNCGKCGNVCKSYLTCKYGGCRCPSTGGDTDCGTYCTDLSSDPNNCSKCGKVCAAGQICSKKVCCAAGLTSCNGLCVDLQTDPFNCGSCGTTCPGTNAASFGCQAGQCTVSLCNAGFGNCNNNGYDGCETNVNSDIYHCGNCATVCSKSGGTTPTCDGTCHLNCTLSNRDCNNDPNDGCEIETLTDRLHCGSCDGPGHDCSVPHGKKGCYNGVCVYKIIFVVLSCDTGWGNCDDNGDNGCETDLHTPANCGGCGNVCPPATPNCPAGVCTAS